MRSLLVGCASIAAVLAISTDRVNAEEIWSPTTGPQGGYVTSVLLDGSTGLAGSFDGLYRSSDSGRSWSPVDAGLPEAPRVEYLHAHDGHYFLATFSHGLFRSDDGGFSWSPSTNGIAGLSPSYLASDGSSLYLMTQQTIDFGNLFRSTDNGDSWTQLTSVPSPFLSLDATDGVLVGASSAALGMYRSTDDGASWAASSDGFPFSEISETMTAIDGKFFVGTNRSGVYESTDLGLTWTARNGGLSDPFARVTGLASSGADILVSLWGEGIYRTPVDGASWTSESGIPSGWGQYVQAVDLDGDQAIAGLIKDGVLHASARGASWESSTGLTATSISRLLQHEGIVLASTGTDGVAMSEDEGETWSISRDGIPVRSQVFVVGEHQGVYLAGMFYEGISRSLDGGGSWIPANAGYPIYNGTAGNQYREVGDFASNGNMLFVGTGTGTEFIDGSFQLTGEGVYRSTNDGATWTPANSGFPIIGTDNFGELRYDPVISMSTVAGTVFASTFQRGIYRTTNDGANWIESNAGLPSSGGQRPEFSSFVELGGDIFAGSIGFPIGTGGTGLFRSSTSGASWFQANNGIPGGFRILDILLEDGILYASVQNAASTIPDGGIYRSTNQGDSWEPFGTGIETAIPNHLAATETRLLAGTQNVGVWKLLQLDPADVSDLGPFATGLKLRAPVPNPATTGIAHLDFELAEEERVTLELVNASGRLERRLLHESRAAGRHSITVDLGDVPSGVFFVRLIGTESREIRSTRLIVRR